ncbi:hypothetical protein [Emticicia agri]|uniref:Uncharacterized protein n=1 Tax=Emticicia agri TaxID=2492393 RepID=A0A4Q5LWZ4_9BACT|nr:hypothetical protein [Emticicia agri]RYU94346.1 hypothetical protein EWM59_17630 [Emticicia agri]
MGKQIFTREQLYKELWNIPLSTFTKEYDINYNKLKELCIKLNIPLPKAGHWQQLQFGKDVKQIPLPAYSNDDQIIELNFKTEEEILNSEILSEKNKKINEMKSILEDDLRVPNSLINPERIIASTRKHYLAYYKRKWDSDDFSLPYLNLGVSEQQLQRALIFMDTFIKILKKKGYEIVPAQNNTILFNDVEIKIALREKTKVINSGKDTWHKTKEVTGKFIFKIEAWGSKEWTDGVLSIEEKLPEIIYGIELLAEQAKQKVIERDNWLQELERQRAIRVEFEKRQKQDLLSFKDSLEKAERWDRTKNLRTYISEVEQRAKENNNYTDELNTRLERLRQQADWYDPFINAKDELLDTINRVTLDLSKNEYYY